MKSSWLSLRLLVLSLIATVLLASVSLGLVFNWVYENSIETVEDEQFSIEKDMLRSVVSTYELSSDKTGFLAAWRRPNWQLQVTSLIHFPLPAPLQDSLKAGDIVTLDSEEGVSLHLLSGTEVISLYLPPSKVETSLQFGLTSLFYICLLGLILLWIYPLVLRLLVLRQSAQQFGNGNLGTRVEVGSHSYIADLEFEFNAMAQRIENLVEDIKLLSSAVSHDIRTPLARIRFGVEAMIDEDDQSSRERLSERIDKDIDDMLDLVEHMLDFSRLEKQLLQAESTQMELCGFIERLIEQNTTSEKHIEFQTADSAVEMCLNPHFIGMLTNNLLGNAIKFSQAKVKMSVQQENAYVLICVEDDGAGIVESKRVEILKPFVRANNSSEENGYGLGLAVVKRIVEFYRGELDVGESATLGGACFSVKIPICK